MKNSLRINRAPMAKKNFTYSSWHDVTRTLSMTVGSSSVHRRSTMLKLVSVLVLILTLGVGNVWGAPTTYNFSSIPTTGWSTSGGSQTINGKSWTYSSSTYIGNSSSKIQVGSSKNPQTSNWTIQTAISNFGANKKITAVAITAYTTATTATYDISVGGSSVKSGSLTTSSATYTASSLNATSGNIVITMKGSSTSKAMYLCEISVTYEDAGGGCTAPTITAQPTGATYTQNDVATAMSITASGTSVTYQWYSNTSNSTSGASPISGATSSSYTPPTSTVGTKYYYCVASSSTCTTTSNIVSVVVNAPRYTVSFSTGTGNPTQANIQEASGGSGITLPAGPTPACSGDGWSFAGWGYESCDDESTEPTLYIPGTTYYPESDETLYAVYVKNKTASTNYKLISSGAQLVSGENYVIAAYYNSNDYAITAEIQSSYYIKQTAVTVNASNIISNPGAKTIWQLTKETGSNVSLYNSNQSKYLYVYASSTYRNLGLYDSKKQFTMTEEREAGYASTFAFESTDYTSYYINYDASHTDFGTKTSSDENLYLYKRLYTGTYESNPTCCTELGSINGSVNLSTSSTGTSVSVSVLTEGVNAYGDADNVSGYDFKLYTASAGGSAAATYSSDSKAGTSHTFTGLTPLTQYWVTVRPIGSGSYCNTTAESDRVAIYTCPGSPNHVDVSGRWDRFGGETISLTAAAYATAGTGTAIPAAKITGYQWQKWYNSQWNNISNAGTTSGATTNNLQIASCSNENSGSYRCVVSTVAGCDIASDGFQVKVYALECYNSGTTVYNFTRTGDTQAGTVQIDLSASTNYGYKVHADNDYYGNSGTVNEDVTNWEMSTGVSNNLTVASGLGGTFTFAIDYSTGGNNSTEGIPEISVTYPRKTIYLTPGVWNVDGAKFAIYYFRKVEETTYGNGWTDFITANDCGSSADIPQWNGVKMNVVRLKNTCTSPNWSDKWAQTNDITVSSNDYVTITGWNESDYTYTAYAIPTYTISYTKGSVPTGGGSISGSKADETKTCGVDFTLPAAQFTTTGYVQTGWSKADGGAQYAAVSGTYTDNAAQTFYPVWTANTHTLTWDANGGDALTGDYTSGTVAYATTITAPNTPTWTGHRFDGWDNGSGVVTPATTMPDNDLSYTAQWSLASYTVTLNVNGGTINAGNVTSYTYGTGATLPTNVTRDGYRFDGWFSDDGVWSDQVTAISTTATGDKTYYAKWTQVYTVTWSVNGDTWSSGVVEGNTHVPGGSKVSALPTAPTKSDCDDSKVFVGWKAAEIDGTSASNPGSIFTTQAGSPTISANTTFYAVFADVSARQTISLSFPDDNSANNGLTSNYYTSEWTAKAGTFSFTISNFNNNNWGGSWTNIRCGRNEIASTAYITTDAAISFRVDSVYVTVDAITATGVNAFKVQVANASTFATPAEVDITQSAAVQKIKIASPATGKYYRIVADCNNSVKSNGYVRISNVTFMQQADTANYVTSCSSCDDDATYTNTTPTVSDIDCTTATLTMEDGLATVGADGCHVSDYGFVIGTSDNPAVDGDGVTKLQVGTSDPTIGADFSYDVTGLTKGTRYYIRAYAKNGNGTAYSTSTNFWTKNVSSIAITTAPTKTNYIVGETFDATGMVVTATMASGATEDVTSDVTYSTDALTAGTNKDFAIEYTLCETAKSVNQKINVYTLTVTEGTNPSYGTAAGSVNIVSITGLGEHKTYTVTVTSSNATAVDNGDNTWTITNPTGNVAVRVDYADAAQVKVYYKVDGVTVTGLTQDVYQSETTTLPTASELATAMTAQSMDIPDDSYPNFVGWSETEFPAQTAEPSIVSGTPTINAEKTYYAVYTNLNKITIIPSDFSTSYPSSGSADGTKTFGGKRFGWNYLLNGNVSKTNLPLQFKKNATEYGRLYNTDPLNYILRIEIGYYSADSYVPVYVASGAGTISGDALTPASRSGSDPYVYTMPASTSYFYIKGDNSTVYKIRSVDIYYSPATVYYMTQFCTNRVTLTQNSPEHGTVEFGRSSLVTCGSDKNVSLTITPEAGYQLHSYEVATGSGKVATKSVSPAISLDNNSSAAQNITLTFADEANGAYDVTASFSLMTVTSWAWTLNSAAIPDPLNLYVGQTARLDVAYTPAGVDASKKTYTRTKVDAYINWVGALNANYSTISGKASTGESTTEVTFTHADGPSTTVNVKVLPLPLVHFGDIVHNVSFDDVVATLSDNTLSPTKTTPTHADFDGATKNTCEEQHLHLVGWIREDWPALVTYLEGGAQPSTSDITTAGDDASGNAYFFAPGASINTQTFNGVTFYAVWAKVE